MVEAFAYNINWYWIYWVLTVIYAVTVVAIIGVVVSENRNPVKSLAWVTVLLLLPVMGIVLYLFFGRSIKNKRMISRRNRRRLRKRAPVQNIDVHRLPLSAESRQEIELARSLTGSQFYLTESLDIFTSGQDKFDSLLKDIAAA